MVTEIILKEFIAAIFKNSVVKKYTDPLLEDGIEKLKSIFRKKNKEPLLEELTISLDPPKQLAEKHSQDFDDLLADEEFKQTLNTLVSDRTIYASVVNTEFASYEDVKLTLKNSSGKSGDIAYTLLNNKLTSKGNIDIDING